ncbi:MAG TPA: 50S ribosomal protein L15 [Planctomycetota bacterium]|nr:50S ribosomal protein L15 [Planctomycetota bacterium]
MDLQKVRKIRLDVPRRFRVGIGPSSGIGKTAGRGGKGQTARSGHSLIVYFEGGQMPLARKLPKRGFNNRRFARIRAEVTLQRLEKNFKDGDVVSPEVLATRNLIPGAAEELKVLGGGDLTRKLTVRAHGFSASAKQKIEKAGGTAEVIAPTPRVKRNANVRLGVLEAKFKDGDVVDPAALVAAGLLKQSTRPVKFIKGGTLTKKLTVKAHRFSRLAAQLIRRAGGEPVLLS